MSGGEQSPHLGQRVWSTAKGLYASALVSTGMVLANVYGAEEMAARADAPLLKQAEETIPSVLIAPYALGPRSENANIGIDVGSAALAVCIARKNMSLRAMAVVGGSGQLVASGADALVDRAGVLTHTELAQPDDGPSAVIGALITYWGLSRARASQEHKKAWYLGLAVFAGAMAIGVPLYEGSQGGTLDASSHVTSMAAGGIAYMLHERRKHRRADRAQTAHAVESPALSMVE